MVQVLLLDVVFELVMELRERGVDGAVGGLPRGQSVCGNGGWAVNA